MMYALSGFLLRNNHNQKLGEFYFLLQQNILFQGYMLLYTIHTFFLLFTLSKWWIVASSMITI